MSIDRMERPTRPAGITYYYDQRGVIVNDQWLLVYGAQFAIADLYFIERARGPMTPPTRRALWVAAAGLVVFAPAAVLLESPAIGALAVLTMLAAAVAAYLCGRRWPASFQLWAEHYDKPRLLFTTHDEQEFGKVRRALIRAIEQRHRQ
ncbi:DUF6232 family protein [Actinomycetes bacterium KLBMP 9797]